MSNYQRTQAVYMLQGVSKSIRGEFILNHISLTIYKGEFLALIGPSGSGKSSLLYILGLLDRPDKGDLYFFNHKVTFEDKRKIIDYRNRYLGFVFQFHYLIPELTVAENVILPQLRAGRSLGEAYIWTHALLNELGLTGKERRKVYELSGGEMQRVAIARALANSPPVLLCDEPTGNLDTENTQRVITLLKDINLRYGTTIILVTHDLSLTEYADRVLQIQDGKIKK